MLAGYSNPCSWKRWTEEAPSGDSATEEVPVGVADVTIGVVARDRFSKAAQSLRRLVEVTPQPYRLLVVDGGTPPRYRKEMERAVKGHPDVEFLTTDHFLNPNAAKNWIIRESKGCEWLALIENDNLMTPGWLDGLRDACEAEGAQVARPMLLERKCFRTFPHFDQRFGSIEKSTSEDGSRSFRIHPRKGALRKDLHAKRALTTVLETHALLFRRSVFDVMGGFDEDVFTRQEVDLALQLVDHDVPIVFEPAVQITYLSPPPVQRAERPFFLFRWDPEEAKRTHQIIREKWRIPNFPDSLHFVECRAEHVSYSRFFRYYARWELSHYLKYKAYLVSSHFPGPLRRPVHRMLYG